MRVGAASNGGGVGRGVGGARGRAQGGGGGGVTEWGAGGESRGAERSHFMEAGRHARRGRVKGKTSTWDSCREKQKRVRSEPHVGWKRIEQRKCRPDAS